MILEPMLEGEYKKHSNNFGFVDKEDRNTPQVWASLRSLTKFGEFSSGDKFVGENSFFSLVSKFSPRTFLRN